MLNKLIGFAGVFFLHLIIIVTNDINKIAKLQGKKDTPWQIRKTCIFRNFFYPKSLTE